MERCGQLQEQLSEALEHQPCHNDAGNAGAGSDDCAQAAMWPVGLVDQFYKAGGANDAPFVFGDTFPAEESPALRALGGGFAAGVVETSLPGQVR
jgi:hypothetical protein